jgi:hypothetical protein
MFMKNLWLGWKGYISNIIVNTCQGKRREKLLDVMWQLKAITSLALGFKPVTLKLCYPTLLGKWSRLAKG